MSKFKTTREYFNKSIDELLVTNNEYGYTKEECLIFDDGLRVHFCDDETEYNEFLQDYKEYFPRLEIKHVLETINKRLAIVLY